MFHCAHARATRFQSSLGFRSDDFGDQTITEVLLNLWQPLDQEQMALSLASHIWKARCTQFFQVKQARPDKTLLAVEAWSRAIRLTKYRFPTIPTDTTTNPLQQADDQYYNCFLDGSFKDPDKGGATYIFYFNERLIRYEIIYKEEAASPFQMEAIALLQAVQAAMQMGIRYCMHFLYRLTIPCKYLCCRKGIATANRFRQLTGELIHKLFKRLVYWQQTRISFG